MRNEVVLITGANGEIGHGLINRLNEIGNRKIDQTGPEKV